MDNRKRVKARRSTGGKAPRKTLTIMQLREWEKKRDESEEEETESKETQTFPSTSDTQVQCGAETNTSATQTSHAKSIIKLEKDLKTVGETLEYVQGEMTLLWQRTHRAERMNKILLNEKTSICNKDCCKNSL